MGPVRKKFQVRRIGEPSPTPDTPAQPTPTTSPTPSGPEPAAPALSISTVDVTPLKQSTLPASCPPTTSAPPRKKSRFLAPKSLTSSTQAVAQAPTPQETEDEIGTVRCFKALFARPKEFNKKSKKFEDGILKIVGKHITLFSVDNATNPLIKHCSRHDCHYLKEGSEFEHLRFTIELDTEIAVDMLTSGRVFLSSTPTTSSSSSLPKAPPKKFQPASKPLNDPVASKARLPIVAYAAKEGEYVLFQGHGRSANGAQLQDVVLDKRLNDVLRPHQRDGIQFMYDCTYGASQQGCILADEMGLGKTLQTLCLLKVLLSQSRVAGNRPPVRKAVIVCPKTLSTNWVREVKKWGALLSGVKIMQPTTAAATTGEVKEFAGMICNETSDGEEEEDTRNPWQQKRARGKRMREKSGGLVLGAGVKQSSHMKNVLVISYEMFRKYSEVLAPVVDIVVCDEGHRLKNSLGNKTIEALEEIRTRRRIILTGTPIQNDLEEYYAMCNFVCPNVLGDLAQFREVFVRPITRSQDKGCKQEERELGAARAETVASLSAEFVLRRTSAVNDKYLPPKHELYVFCRPSQLQEKLYKHTLHSGAVQDLLRDSPAHALMCIRLICKIAAHPALIWDTGESGEVGLRTVLGSAKTLFPPDFLPSCHTPELSGKLFVLDALMTEMMTHTSDKAVLISNYTQTLGVVEAMCVAHGWEYGRLDGGVGADKRTKLVDELNAPLRRDRSGMRLLLVSAKAGGTGLNLVGANRVVLFEPDWNPATDLQSMMRVWRDGQKKTVIIYRLFTTGTIDEKMLQRQMSKLEVASVVQQKDSGTNTQHSTLSSNGFSSEELKHIFSFNTATACETFDHLQKNQRKSRTEWKEFQDSSQIPDTMLQSVYERDPDAITYVHVESQRTAEAAVAIPPAPAAPTTEVEGEAIEMETGEPSPSESVDGKIGTETAEQSTCVEGDMAVETEESEILVFDDPDAVLLEHTASDTVGSFV